MAHDGGQQHPGSGRLAQRIAKGGISAVVGSKAGHALTLQDEAYPGLIAFLPGADQLPQMLCAPLGGRIGKESHALAVE